MRLWIGAALIALILLPAILAPWFAPPTSALNLAARYEAPSAAHPCGRDQNGADVLSEILQGARISLAVALSAVLCSSAIGLAMGSLAGWRGGATDAVLMRLTEMAQAFPGFLLALALAAALGPSILNVTIALSLTGWTGYARLARGEVRRLKGRDHVIAAQALGASAWRQLAKHVWPCMAGTIIAQMTFGVAGAVIAESSLSFLGLGAPPSVPTWGSLLSAGRRALLEAPHLSLFPGLAMLLLVAGFNLLGGALQNRRPRAAMKAE